MSWVAVGMAGAGLLKSELIDRPQADKQRQLRAAEIRYSPWTKMGPQTQVKEADPFGSAMQGGMTGFMMGQGAKDPFPQTTVGLAPAAGSNAADYWGSMPQTGWLGTNTKF